MSTNILFDQAARSYHCEVPPPEKESHRPGELPFITISRESWASGRELAETILEEMNRRAMDAPFREFKVYDRELCEKLTEERHLHVPLNALLAEEYHSLLEDSLLALLSDRSSQYEIEHHIIALVMQLALAGRCILVGRGGVCVTRNLPGGIHIRLVAPEKIRVQRMAKHYGIAPEAAQKRIRKQDEDKKRFFREYFNREITDPLLYDAVFNTERLPLEEVARHVIEMTESRYRSIHAGQLETMGASRGHGLMRDAARR